MLQVPPGGPKTSGLAIASFVCGLLGFFCVTAAAAVVLALAALVSIAGAPYARRGKGFAIAGLIMSLGWLIIAVVVGVIVHGQSQPVPVIPIAPAPPPMISPVPGSTLAPGAAALEQQVRANVAAAEAAGQRLVLFFDSARCEPCAAARRTLSAPDLAPRLAAVRLLQLDVDSWPAAEIDRVGATLLGRRIIAIPLFCVVRSRLPPVCVDGGAWGQDTDPNIRAVLLPFLESPPSGLVPYSTGVPVTL